MFGNPALGGKPSCNLARVFAGTARREFRARTATAATEFVAHTKSIDHVFGPIGHDQRRWSCRFSAATWVRNAEFSEAAECRRMARKPDKPASNVIIKAAMEILADEKRMGENAMGRRTSQVET
jgi:hypothetical protein